MKNFDSYYDPPDEEQPCQICHSMECECPECKVCGVAGSPACINVHMNWREWGHFLFKPTAKELKDDWLRYAPDEDPQLDRE